MRVFNQVDGQSEPFHRPCVIVRTAYIPYVYYGIRAAIYCIWDYTVYLAAHHIPDYIIIHRNDLLTVVSFIMQETVTNLFQTTIKLVTMGGKGQHLFIFLERVWQVSGTNGRFHYNMKKVIKLDQ